MSQKPNIQNIQYHKLASQKHGIQMCDKLLRCVQEYVPIQGSRDITLYNSRIPQCTSLGRSRYYLLSSSSSCAALKMQIGAFLHTIVRNSEACKLWLRAAEKLSRSQEILPSLSQIPALGTVHHTRTVPRCLLI